MKRELIPYNVMRHADWDRAPKMPQAIAVAIAPGLFVGGVATGLAGTLLVGAISIGLSAVTSWALQALAPKPDFGRFGTSSAGLLVNDRSGIAPHDFIYGEVRKGGTVVYDETTGDKNKFLHRVIALAGHEVEDIGDIYLNDEIAETGGFEYTVAVTYTTSGGKEGTPTTKIQQMTFTGVPTDQATYEVGDSLSVSDISALEDASYESTARNWSNAEFDSASVSAKTQSTDGTVASGPYAGKIRINKHLGDQTTADADLLAESENDQIDASFVGNGIAYIYARFEYDQDVFANGLPLITAKIKGKKVFDPRDDTTAYSNNAALCLRDFLTASYGLQDSDIDEAAFQIAANECDEPVELALREGETEPTTEPKYTMNGVVRADQTFGDVLQQMTTCCTGTLFWGMGAWDLVAGAYSAPVQDFGLDDLRGPISVDPLTNLRDAFNAVSGTFNDASQDYITVDYPTITSSVFEAEDGGERLPLDLELPFTTSAASAQRIAKLTLFRAREQIGVSADFSLKAFNVEVGDIITFTNPRYGWDEKQFEVVGWNLNIGESAGISVRLDLRETSEAAYDWNADETAIIANNTNLPSLTEGLDILNLTASGGGRTQGDGTFINSVILSWTASTNAFVSHYEVEWKPLSDSVYASTTTAETTIELSPLVDGVEYILRVRAVTVSNVRGPYSTVQFTGGGDETAPALPTAISATGHFKYISINWTNPADTDLNYVEVYENTSDSTAGAVKVGISSGDNFQRTNLGLNETRYYFLKAVDYSGNASGFTAGVSATTTFLDDPDFENGIYSLFTEQDLYAIRDVTSLPASGAFEGEKVFNRTDGKLYQWTGSAWEQVVGGAESFGDLQGSIAQSQIPNGTIDTAQIANDAIVAGKISANAVGANAIAANSIYGGAIQAGVITGNKISANTITGGLLATSGIITNSAQINNAVVTNAKIANLAVDTIKVANDSITRQDFVSFGIRSGSGPYIFSFNTSMTFSGSIIAIATIEMFGTTSNASTSFRLRIDGSLQTSYNYNSGTNALALQTLSGSEDVSAGLANVTVEVDNISGITNPSAKCQLTILKRFK